MKTIVMNSENSKMNEPHKPVLNLPHKLTIMHSNELVSLRHLSIYYTWKNIRKQYKSNELKIVASTWNDEFELPQGSYSVSDMKIILNISLKSMKH